MSEATRRRFLEAGGTSCIDKPFSLATLRAGLAEWSPRDEAPPPRPAPPSSAAFDPLPLLDAACGDRALLERIVSTFARDARAHLDAYRRTVETNDAKEAGRRMHQLAGAAGMVGALTLAALARAEMEAQPSTACHTLVSAELDAVLPLLEQLYR
jgi:HPt (histidine-containing phosphotransfer) domain-containing protein